MRTLKSFGEVLASVDDIVRRAATGPPEKQPPPDCSLESWGRQQQMAEIARAEIPNESAPTSQRRNEGFEAYREAWQRQIAADGTLTPSHRVILMILAWYLNRETRTAFPSLDRLAKDTGFSRSTVWRAGRAAEKRGHVKIKRSYQPERRKCTANTYSPVFHPDETERRWGCSA